MRVSTHTHTHVPLILALGCPAAAVPVAGATLTPPWATPAPPPPTLPLPTTPAPPLVFTFCGAVELGAGAFAVFAGCVVAPAPMFCAVVVVWGLLGAFSWLWPCVWPCASALGAAVCACAFNGAFGSEFLCSLCDCMAHTSPPPAPRRGDVTKAPIFVLRDAGPMVPPDARGMA